MCKVNLLLFTVTMSLLITSCASQNKMKALQSGAYRPSLTLAQEEDYIPEIRTEVKAQRDTFIVKDGDRELIIMKAIKDEDGEMVAHDVLDAAVVTARFRNVAERNGRVDIEFQVIVPQSMQDSKWQLRFRPQMYIMQDTLNLDPVIITGAEYRKAQLRGYQQYEKFLSTIITNPDEFVNWWALELFIERNMPQLYAFKSDSTYVSDEQFASAYGVTEKEAIEHYTDKLAREVNSRRMARREKMYRRYVKVPIVNDGLRLDTVIQTLNGDFIYRYVQPIKTRPKLRKVDVVLTGDIYESDTKIYDIPMSDPLTFYISSLSAFVDNREKYLTKVIERRVEENTACYIEFASGSFEVDEKMGNNPGEIGRIKDNLISLMQNEKFDLDSIVVTSSASPEGSVTFNDKLSQKRSEGISDYFSKWMTHYQDSLERERGFAVDEEGNIIIEKRTHIPMMGRSSGENWRMLDRLVERDTVMTEDEKKGYISSADIKDIDQRERAMQKYPYYRHLREKLYPKLRSVSFDFHLHRAGMQKDTVHTTELDTVYMAGLEALRNFDYKMAVEKLRPYRDYNSALAYMSADYNHSALDVLAGLDDKDAKVCYMKAIILSRLGAEDEAMKYYRLSLAYDPYLEHRANLDPELSGLVNKSINN